MRKKGLIKTGTTVSREKRTKPRPRALPTDIGYRNNYDQLCFDFSGRCIKRANIQNVFLVILVAHRYRFLLTSDPRGRHQSLRS